MCNDCDEPGIRYRYVNRSSYDVLLTVVAGTGDTIMPTGAIPRNDSVEFQGRQGEFLGAEAFHPSPSVRAVIAFASAPKRCLEYSGAIIDSLGDPRSPKAYNQDSPFIYTLDDGHFGKASACP